MKNNSKSKIMIIITLVLLVAGMAMLGIFGLNQTADYSSSYEIRVSVDQNVNDAGEIVKDSATKFFADKGVKHSSEIQTMDDGSVFIYKFDDNPEIDVDDLKNTLKTALSANAKTSNLVADAEGAYPLNITYYKEISGVAIALGVSAVVVLLYLTILEKPAAGFAAFVGSLVSAMLFVSILGITRIPAFPAFASTFALSFALSVVLSAVVVNRFNEIKRMATGKTPFAEIAAKGVKQSVTRICFVAGLVAIAAIVLAIFGSLTVKFAALQILVADIVAVFSAKFWTPFIWTLVKKK